MLSAVCLRASCRAASIAGSCTRKTATFSSLKHFYNILFTDVVQVFREGKRSYLKAPRACLSACSCAFAPAPDVNISNSQFWSAPFLARLLPKLANKPRGRSSQARLNRVAYRGTAGLFFRPGSDVIDDESARQTSWHWPVRNEEKGNHRQTYPPQFLKYALGTSLCVTVARTGETNRRSVVRSALIITTSNDNTRGEKNFAFHVRRDS